MRSRARLAAQIAVGSGLLLAMPLQAVAAPSLALEQATCPAPPRGAPTSAGYVTVRNAGPAPDTLLGGSTPAASKVELHSVSMAGGIMRMRPITGGVSIAPGSTLRIVPGSGYHLMLIHPRALKLGETFPLTLHFAKAGDLTTTCAVAVLPAASKADMDMGHMDMGHMDMGHMDTGEAAKPR